MRLWLRCFRQLCFLLRLLLQSRKAHPQVLDEAAPGLVPPAVLPSRFQYKRRPLLAVLPVQLCLRRQEASQRERGRQRLWIRRQSCRRRAALSRLLPGQRAIPSRNGRGCWSGPRRKNRGWVPSLSAVCPTASRSEGAFAAGEVVVGATPAREEPAPRSSTQSGDARTATNARQLELLSLGLQQRQLHRPLKDSCLQSFPHQHRLHHQRHQHCRHRLPWRCLEQCRRPPIRSGLLKVLGAQRWSP